MLAVGLGDRIWRGQVVLGMTGAPIWLRGGIRIPRLPNVLSMRPVSASGTQGSDSMESVGQGVSAFGDGPS